MWALPEPANSAVDLSGQAPAGKEAVGLGEDYSVHGLTRMTAAAFTIAIPRSASDHAQSYCAWITGFDLGDVLLAIAALTVLSVWASRP